jgi:hypothetical protein
LKCKYTKLDQYPNKGETSEYGCCGGTKVVTDKRFDVDYTCPRCTGELKQIPREE